MPARLQLAGQQFGMLTALAPHAATSQGWMWRCMCACGEECLVLAARMVSGNTKSCGCHKRSVLPKSTTKHGKTRTPTYRIWKGMRNRCNNPNTPRYKDYGGRGIRVCSQWDDFAVFLTDMGERPHGMTLDRVDNDGDYEPGNCRWATYQQQAANNRGCYKKGGGRRNDPLRNH